MCKLCNDGNPQDHAATGSSRRDFLKVSAATGAAAAGLGLFNAPSADATKTARRTAAGMGAATSFAAAM